MTTHIEVREKKEGRFVYVKRDQADKLHELGLYA